MPLSPDALSPAASDLHTLPAHGDSPDLALVERMRVRVRMLRAARAAVELSVFALAWAVGVLLMAKLGMLRDPVARRLLCASGLFPLVGALAGALAPVTPLRAAQIIDRAYGLHDALASALQFRALPAAQRTPMMDAAIAATVDRVRAAPPDPRRALGWRWPAETRVALGLLAVLMGTALVEFRDRRVVAATVSPAARGPRDPLVLETDDVQAFRELAETLRPQATSPESRRALDEFQRFLDDVARQRMDRQEAFRRLAALQDSMAAGRDADREALRQALQQLGDRMGGQNELARQLADALHRGDPAGARDAAQALANRLRSSPGMSQAQRQELARALERAAQPAQDREALQERLRRARQEVERMLQRQREQALSTQDESLLHRRQREAQQAQRDSDQAEQQRRQVEHLQRELSQAARDLARDLQQAARDMDQGAQDLSRMQDEQQGRQSMEELRQRLEELRDQMRQQNGQNGQRQRMRLSRFSQAAGGQRGGQPQGGSGGQPGGQPGGHGQQGGQGAAGDPNGDSQAMTPAGPGHPGGTLVLGTGQGGVPIPLNVPGGGQPSGGGSQGTDPGGSAAGTGHDDNLRGAATNLQGQTHAVQVQGQATGAGPSRSQVIRTAAADGFASAPYRTVYTPYWDHAREVLHEGEVPPGYRAYVRRYFQLIRPRE